MLVAADSYSIRDTMKKSLFQQAQSFTISKKKNENLTEYYTIYSLCLNAIPLFGIWLLLQLKNAAVLSLDATIHVQRWLFAPFLVLICCFHIFFPNYFLSIFISFVCYCLFFLFGELGEHTGFVNHVCFKYVYILGIQRI